MNIGHLSSKELVRIYPLIRQPTKTEELFLKHLEELLLSNLILSDRVDDLYDEIASIKKEA